MSISPSLLLKVPSLLRSLNVNTLKVPYVTLKVSKVQKRSSDFSLSNLVFIYSHHHVSLLLLSILQIHPWITMCDMPYDIDLTSLPFDTFSDQTISVTESHVTLGIEFVGCTQWGPSTLSTVYNHCSFDTLAKWITWWISLKDQRHCYYFCLEHQTGNYKMLKWWLEGISFTFCTHRHNCYSCW